MHVAGNKYRSVMSRRPSAITPLRRLSRGLLLLGSQIHELHVVGQEGGGRGGEHGSESAVAVGDLQSGACAAVDHSEVHDAGAGIEQVCVPKDFGKFPFGETCASGG